MRRAEYWMTPKPASAILDLLPPQQDLGPCNYWEWNQRCARLALRSCDGSPARVIGVCIPTDDPTAVGASRVLAALNAFCPPGLSIRAVVVTRTAAVATALQQRADTLGRAVTSIEVQHDPTPFRFARRVNKGARRLLELYPELDAILLANDDTSPTPAACARLATWPLRNSLVGAVSNAGGGGVQSVQAYPATQGRWEEVAFLDSPHRLCGFFLYVTTDAWVSLDGFDEDYDGYGCDDTDFSVRAHAAASRLLIDPIAFVWHRGAATFSDRDMAQLIPIAIETFHRKHPQIETYTVPLPLTAMTGPTSDPMASS